MHLNTNNKNLKSFKVYIIGINKYTVTTCNEDFRKQKTQNNLMLQSHINSSEMGKCIIYRKNSNNLNSGTWISLEISAAPACTQFTSLLLQNHLQKENISMKKKHSSIYQPQYSAFFHFLFSRSLQATVLPEPLREIS